MRAEPTPSDLDPCPLCAAKSGVEVQGQDLALAGLGRAAIGFGYCGACGHIYQVRRASDALLALLRRYSTESAREEARLYCDELVAEEAVVAVDRLLAA